MSSNTYSAELAADPALRVIVLLSGIGLGIVGLMLILGLALPVAAIGLGTAAWLYYMLSAISVLAREFSNSRGLRLYADCSLMRLEQTGHWRAVQLLPGSVVLPGLAWIRYETIDGVRSAEPLRGNGRESHAWRRLQVIWRHIGAAP